MGQASTIGLDIAKWVFQAHGADATGRVVFRKRLVRAKVLEFFAGQPPCLVALEACGGAHYWARELGKLGHTGRLIPPAYVKPFVKRQKNDVADAEAICEAAQRPGMRFVPVKEEAQQANAVVFRARDLLVRQRTQCINALRAPGRVRPCGAARSRTPRPPGRAGRRPEIVSTRERTRDPAGADQNAQRLGRAAHGAGW